MVPPAIHPLNPEMSMIVSAASFLRKVLLVDAATWVGAGALMSLGAGARALLLNLPSALLLGAGIVLFPVAAFIAFVATRARLSAAAAWIVIVGNLLWIGGSLWVMAGGVGGARRVRRRGG